MKRTFKCHGCGQFKWANFDKEVEVIALECPECGASPYDAPEGPKGE